jgi:RNA 2',3'-cyclic 3'-phosphodiesterase
VSDPSAGGAPSQRIRLFVALDLPPQARAALARFRDAAADPAVWRPLAEDSFHVTLAFLGHRPEGDVEVVSGILAGLGDRQPMDLRLGAALLLPPRRARVLTVALEVRDASLAGLHGEVGAALAAAGVFEPESRPFRPHVTVGRLRAGARAPRVVDAEPEPPGFSADAVTLYRSRVGRGGASYEPLVTRRFA